MNFKYGIHFEMCEKRNDAGGCRFRSETVHMTNLTETMDFVAWLRSPAALINLGDWSFRPTQIDKITIFKIEIMEEISNET